MRSTTTVLLVDDIPDHVRAYELALRARAFTVLTAETGGEALAIARAHRPRCIVIDERLSDMRGWELCREIKADPALAAIPIIVLAHELTMEAAARGKRVGCDSWLARPSVADDLVRAVEEVLAAREPAPRTPSEALVGFSTCSACASPRIRAGVRVGPAQYYRCGDCGLRWRSEADGSATA